MKINKFKVARKFHLAFNVRFNVPSGSDLVYTIFSTVILAILYYLTLQIKERKYVRNMEVFKIWRFELREVTYRNLLRNFNHARQTV